MQCRNCGSQIPEGVAFCQQCGTPVNPVLTPQSPSAIPPTVAASQPSYGNSNPNAYTNYNPSSISGNGQIDETTQNPYANNSYNPYAQPQPDNATVYASPPPPNNSTMYAPPSQFNNSTMYASPQQPNNASYGMGIPAAVGAMPTKPKRKVGLIAGIIIAILAVVIIAILLIPKSSHPATAGTGLTGPSGKSVDPTASSIITNIKMASAVDTDTYQPKTLATTFKTYTDIYSTFQFDITKTDVSQQNPGYVEPKYYIQNSLALTGKILKVDNSVAPSGNGYGYFTVQFYHPTNAGAVEIYWCRKSDCSDGKLAQTTTFTVN